MGANALSMAVRIAAAVILFVAIKPVAAETDPDELAARYTAWILDEVPEYRDHRKDRALAGCIQWGSTTPDNIRVDDLVWFYLDPTLGGWSMMPSKLMNQAMGLCAQRRPDNAPCECARIARGRESVLEIPDTVLARFATLESGWSDHETEWFHQAGLAEVAFARLEPRGQAPLVPATNVSLLSGGVYVVLRWDRALADDTSYLVRYELLDPTGTAKARRDTLIKPADEAGRSWHFFAIKRQLDQPGLWRVAIHLDGRKVAERPLQIQPAP